MDLADLLKNDKKEVFTLETKEIGTLKISFLTHSSVNELKSKYDYFNNAPPIEIVRFLITLVAYHPNSNEDNLSDDLKISADDALKLSDSELNNFADNFIGYNEDYLFNEKEKGAREKREKEDKESSISYLSRLLLYKIEDYIKEEENIVKASVIGNLNNLFSNHLTSNILDTFESQRKLYESRLPFQKQIEDIQKYSTFLQGTSAAARPFEPSTPIRIERPVDRIRETNERLDVIIDYQSKMGPVIEDSSNLLGDMNKLWIGMAADSKEDSNKIIRLTWLIILITVISLISALLFSILNYKSSIENSKITEKYMSLLIEENRKLNNNIHEYQSSLNKFLNNQSDKNNLIKPNKKLE